MQSLRTLQTTLLAFLLGFQGHLQAGRVTVMSPATLVNSDGIAGNQTHGTIAMNSQGLTLVTWHSSPSLTETKLEVRYRWYDDNGALGQGLLLTEASDGQQFTPDVSTDGESRFVVAWCELRPTGEYDVYGKMFASSGAVLLDRFKINDASSQSECFPSISMNANGDFIVVWSSFDAEGQDVLARIYDNTGTARSGPFAINKDRSAIDDNTLPDVDLNNLGKAAVAWSQSSSQTGTSAVCRVLDIHSLHLTRVAYIQKAVAGEFQKRVMIDGNDAGNIVLTYISENKIQDLRQSVQVAIFNPLTSLWGTPFQPNSSEFDNLDRITVSTFPNGSFICSWDEILLAQSDRNIYARYFNSEGVAISPEQLINQEITTSSQKRPSIAAIKRGPVATLRMTFESGSQSGVGENNDVYIKTYQIQ